MERYEEKKRERRRRDFRRVVQRAVARMRRQFGRPGDVGPSGACRTWDDVFRARCLEGRRRAEIPSCARVIGSAAGNTRATWGDRTRREYRQALAAMEQLIESRVRDEEPGRRRLKLRGPWP
ncbi:MAG: hypothetical protein IPI48_16155 [bacterium]|nr:hypothetical protein [bacterium]